jgi:hypothetical protein
VDLNPGLVWAAALTVRAHLTKLEREGTVVAERGGVFRLA